MKDREYRNRGDTLVITDSFFDSTEVWIEITQLDRNAACMFLSARQQRALVNAIEQKLKEKQP